MNAGNYPNYDRIFTAMRDYDVTGYCLTTAGWESNWIDACRYFALSPIVVCYPTRNHRRDWREPWEWLDAMLPPEKPRRLLALPEGYGATVLHRRTGPANQTRYIKRKRRRWG